MALLVSLAIAAGCAGQDAPSASAWSIDSARVVFSGNRDGNRDVYLLVPGTAQPVRLTSDPSVDNFGRFAPDGSTLAFQSGRTGAIDIYVMNADGAGLVNLTDHPAYDVLPAWAPDGRRLAFMSTRGFELGSVGPFPGHLYVVDADGGNLQQITRTPLTSSLGPQDWTPDGRGILLSRRVDGSLDLFLLNVATGEEARLTSDPANEYGGAFSHDGSLIAFHVEADGVSRIVVTGRDGTARRTITPGPGLRYGPRWSPDDAWLLYTVQGRSETDWDLEAVRVADGQVVPIVVTPEDEREADWVVERRE
jgi:TolB protein